MRSQSDAAQVKDWVEISDLGARTVVRIEGELDLATREAIESKVLRVVETGSSVVIDLEAVTFCDSNGLALLINAKHRATATGTTLALRNLSPSLDRLLDVTGIRELLGTTGGC